MHQASQSAGFLDEQGSMKAYRVCTLPEPRHMQCIAFAYMLSSHASKSPAGSCPQALPGQIATLHFDLCQPGMDGAQQDLAQPVLVSCFWHVAPSACHRIRCICFSAMVTSTIFHGSAWHLWQHLLLMGRVKEFVLNQHIFEQDYRQLHLQQQLLALQCVKAMWRSLLSSLGSELNSFC